MVTQACDPANPSGSPMTVADINAIGGSWGFSITNPLVCPPGPPKIAIRQDGAVVIALPLQISQPLLVLDGLSGAVISNPSIPPSTITDVFGSSQSCDCSSHAFIQQNLREHVVVYVAACDYQTHSFPPKCVLLFQRGRQPRRACSLHHIVRVGEVNLHGQANFFFAYAHHAGDIFED